MRAASADEVLDALRVQEVEVLSVEHVDALADISPDTDAERQPLLEPRSGRPPAAPRDASEYQTSILKNVPILVGGIFVAIASVFIVIGLGLLLAGETAGVFMTLFPMIHFTIGMGLLLSGLRKRSTRSDVIERGEVVLGRVTATGLNRRTRINGRNPFLLDYEFEALGATHTGQRSTLDDRITSNQVGDRVWVLHDPADASRNVVWPPV